MSCEAPKPARCESTKSTSILPIRLDDTELPGVPATVAYLDLRTISVKQLVELLLQKLRDDATAVPEYRQAMSHGHPSLRFRGSGVQVRTRCRIRTR
jgi:hypothetical protein